MTVISLIGRPNVGKSSLFNEFLGHKKAIVSPVSGVTRDRHSAEAIINNQSYTIIDTAGLTRETDDFKESMHLQSEISILAADLCLWMIDYQTGLSEDDQALLQKIRKENIPCWLVVNKVDNRHESMIAKAEYYSTGMKQIFPISCHHKNGIEELKNRISEEYPPMVKANHDTIRVAFIGKPNAGKSTLMNACVRENRVIVSQTPGTTRDSIEHSFEYDNQHYQIIDTAGLRKQSKVSEALEHYSNIRTLMSLKNADVAIFLIDGTLSMSQQDEKLVELIINHSKPLVIAMNKSDLGTKDFDASAEYIKLYPHLKHFPQVNISALQKKGIGRLFKEAKRVYQCAHETKLSTSMLTDILEAAVDQHPPPLVGTRRIRPRIAHPIGKCPPIHIGIKGKQLTKLPSHYKQYLQSFFQKALDIQGLMVILTFKDDLNPYNQK